MLGGCVSGPADPMTAAPGLGDCLRRVQMNDIQQALERCNSVVEAHPNHPQPRNERALLHSQAGNNATACRDSLAAAKLLKQLPAQPPADPLLVEEIELRAKSCGLITNAPAADAPSPAGSGG